MKYSKRYIVFGVLVAAMLIFKLEPGASGSGTVENFRGANLQATTWNPLIASSVNDNLLSLVIDNKEYTNENHTFYMDDQLNIMVPVNILRDALNCSAHVYDGKRLLVEKHANEVEFSLGASEAKVNGTREVIVSPFIRKDDTYYVSLNDLANYLDYSYSWDIQENQALAMDTSDSAQSGNFRHLLGVCRAGGTGVVVAAGRETAVFGRPYDDEQRIYTDAG